MLARLKRFLEKIETPAVMLMVLSLLNDVGYNGNVDDGVCEQHRPCHHQWGVVGSDYHRNLVQETLLWKQTVSKC